MSPRYLLFAVFLAFNATPTQAQNVPLPLTRTACLQIVEAAPWHLLQSRGNTRFASEMLPLHRPSLTFNGFDNTRDGLNPNERIEGGAAASGWADVRFDVSSWPSGLYVVRVVQGASAQTARLTVRR